MKFRKKPVVIEAVQFDGSVESWHSLCDWMGIAHNGNNSVSTLEGNMNVSKDDWVIRGVKGEFYPCKPDIFEATYEPAE